MKLLYATATAMLTVAPLCGFAADLLTPAQVEKIVGISGVQTKPSKYDKGGTSFVGPKGEPVIALKVQAALAYDVWKNNAGPNAQPVAGIGADAFLAKDPALVCFKKADKGICVTAMQPLSDAVPVSNAQLLELARAAAASL